MATVAVRQTYAQSPEVLWGIIGDPADIAKWVPSIESVRMDGDDRYAQQADGTTVVERVVGHDDAGRNYTYAYVEGPLPLARYSSTIRVTAGGSDGSGGAEVRWDADFAAAGDDAAIEQQLQEGIESIYRAALTHLATVASR